MSWRVIFFSSHNGRFPVRDFISTLEPSIVAKITTYLDLLSEFGPFLKPPFIKKINSEIYELRIKGKKQLRVLYAKKQNSFILLHGFIKKTQKTPKKELEIALDRLSKLT